MTTLSSADSVPPITLTLSPRDAQWLAAMAATVNSMLNVMGGGSMDVVDNNVHGLVDIYYGLYSPNEASALNARLYSLVPLDSKVKFHREGELPFSRTSFVS